MTRQIVSLLLLPYLLLAQSATAIGHAHASDGQAGGETRAHVHFGQACRGHDHHHGHGHDGPGHHHAHPGHGPASQPVDPACSCTGHDSSAIYLDSVDEFVSTQKAVDRELTNSGFANIWVANMLTPRPAQAMQRMAYRRHGPPPDYDHPVYLLHSALLL